MDWPLRPPCLPLFGLSMEVTHERLSVVAMAYLGGGVHVTTAMVAKGVVRGLTAKMIMNHTCQ